MTANMSRRLTCIYAVLVPLQITSAGEEINQLEGNQILYYGTYTKLHDCNINELKQKW